MNTSDWIQLLVGIITGCSALISIDISIKTLKQNSKMIEENTRPNIIIYKDVYNFNSPIEFLVIKNIGSSLAKIDDLIYDEIIFKDIFSCYNSNNRNTFEYLKNASIAPNQDFKIPINTRKIEKKETSITIKYSNVKSYTETFKIHLDQDYGVSFVNQHQNGKELKDISNVLQELVKRI